jgi:tetratricopeptide (TPR) repeat protein
MATTRAPASRALLAAATGQGEEVVLAGLEAACRARLLLEEGDEAYAFAHDVIREVVEADLGAGRRMLLHRRVARALEAAPGMPPVARIAYHYAQTDDHAAAALWLERAGDEAVRHYAHAVAREHYAEARRRRHMAGSDAVLVAGLDEKLGLALRTAGQHERALTVLEQAAEAYQTAGDREGAARAVAGIGQLYFDLGRPEAGLPRLQPVLAALEGAAPSPGLAALHDTLAWLLYGAGRYRESRAAAVRAAELARLVGDERIVASATRNGGYALLALGQLAEARPVFEDAVAHAEVAGDLDVLCRSLNALNVVHLYTGDFTTAAQYSARALDTAKRLADPALIALLTHDASIPAFFQGDWDAARQGFERALTLYRALERPWAWGYAYALAELGWLALAEGRWEEAQQALDESIALAERMRARDVLRMVQPLRAELDLGHGQPARAGASARRAGGPWAGGTGGDPRVADAGLDLSGTGRRGDGARGRRASHPVGARRGLPALPARGTARAGDGGRAGGAPG